jgi:hypothetical protein
VTAAGDTEVTATADGAVDVVVVVAAGSGTFPWEVADSEVECRKCPDVDADADSVLSPLPAVVVAEDAAVEE